MPEAFGQRPQILFMHGLPVVACLRSGAVFAVLDSRAVLVTPPNALTPDMLGLPVGWRHAGAAFEVGPYALQVGQPRATVWSAHALTDAHWRGSVRDDVRHATITPGEAGFSRFHSIYGWLDPDRLLLTGQSTDERQGLGLRIFAVIGTRENLALEPVDGAPTWLASGSGAQEARGRIWIDPSGSAAMIDIAARDRLYRVHLSASGADVRTFRLRGPAPRWSEVVDGAPNRDVVFVLAGRQPAYTPHPVPRLERWILQDDGQMEGSPLQEGPSITDATVLHAGARRLLALKAASDDGLVRFHDLAHPDAAPVFTVVGPDATEVSNVALGPDCVMALGTSIGRTYLMASQVFGATTYRAGARALALPFAPESFQLAAGPDLAAVLLYGNHRVVVNVHGVPLEDGGRR